VQRKVLTANDFDDLDQVRQRLAGFERFYNEIAELFASNFTREKLNAWRPPQRPRSRVSLAGCLIRRNLRRLTSKRR
jgi:hypothetical protein